MKLFKTCKICNIEKPIKEFPFRKDQNKYRNFCIKCSTEKTRARRLLRYANKKEQICQQIKQYKELNKNSVRERSKKYRDSNKETLAQKNKEYRQKNKEIIQKKSNDYRSVRAKKDPMYSMKLRIRSRTRLIFKKRKWNKSAKFDEYLGCTLDFFKTHIESLFLDGMSWENRNLWHLDHIIPLKAASTPEELIRLCHYTNIQPLWALDNIKKGAKF